MNIYLTKTLSRVWLVILIGMFLTFPGFSTPKADPLKGLDGFIAQVMKEFKIPGLALAVLKDGKLFYKKGFGFRDLARKKPVTPETFFAIGSCSKAFTALAIGILADRKKIDWLKPIQNYLKDFQLKDPFISSRLNILDLLSHRTGLPRHDNVWYGSPLSRKELFLRLRYLDLSKDIRQAFQYNNLMYMVAGLLVERISGQTWEAFVKTEIFKPLGMNQSHFSTTELEKGKNVALPYIELKGKLKQVPYRNIEAVGPAGSINSNVGEMTNWLLLNLNQGKFKGRPVISPANLKKVHEPQIIIDPDYHKSSGYVSYALGWGTGIYKGHQIYTHQGGIDGFTSQVTFFPQEKFGFVILANLSGAIINVIGNQIADRILGLPTEDWIQKTKKRLKVMKAAMDKQRQKAEKEIQKGALPPLPLTAYTGAYVHPGYGTLTISLVKKTLHVKYNGVDMTLRYVKGGTFQFLHHLWEFVLLGTFQIKGKDQVVAIGIPFEPTVSPIQFIKVAK